MRTVNNQKGSITVALLVGLVIILGGALGYTFWMQQAAKSDAVILPQDDSKILTPTLEETSTSTHETQSFHVDNCETPEAQMVIAEKELIDVHSCKLKKMHANGKDMIIITVSYGQGIDCFAGCTVPQTQAAIVDGKVVDALLATRPQKVSFAASRQMASSDRGIIFTVVADYNMSKLPFYNTFVDFGDGQSSYPIAKGQTHECGIANDATCVDIRSAVHWYYNPGVYTARLINDLGTVATVTVEIK